MKSITSKGFFGTDLGIAFFVILLMFFLMVSALSNEVNKNIETKELVYLKTKALFYADSLVKNSNEKEPEKGIAFYDEEKKRIEENVVDLGLVEKIEEKKFPEYLKEIRIEFGEQKIIKGKKTGKCFEARRLVLIQETKEKGVVFVSACI
ncbi:hypothetical protein KKG83_01795 [Candidatus Micrarchaeota archaeon]|nr:hypothetical protein [Candidatus Micrarchaeota archaeon]